MNLCNINLNVGEFSIPLSKHLAAEFFVPRGQLLFNSAKIRT